MIFATLMIGVIFSNEFSHQQDESEISKLAAKAKVELIISPKDFAPPESPIGINIPYKWQVTETSLENCRAVLMNLSGPKKMNIQGPIKKGDLEKLARLASEIKGVHVNRSPIVAIGVIVNSKSFEISAVLSGMPFEKSGFKKGDRIVSVNGVAVNSFKELTRELCKYEPGNTVVFVVDRGKRQVRLTVEFGSRPKPSRKN